MLFRTITIIITIVFYSATAQKGESLMNFWSEIVKEVGTVLVEVLVRIAEEMENND